MHGEARHCGVCGRVLQHITQDGREFYRHAPIDLPEDHPPVAIRHIDNPEQVQYRCDFCLSEPITHTLVVDHDIHVPGVGSMDPEWAMCLNCSELILGEDWEGMRKRAFEHYENRSGKMPVITQMMMVRVYEELKDSVVMIYKEGVS